MKLATVRTADGDTRAARLDGDEHVLLAAADLGELLCCDDWRAVAAQDGPRESVDPTRTLTPIPNPSKVYCVGRNYLNHIQESNPAGVAPDYPELFVKFAESLVGPVEQIAVPNGSGFSEYKESIAHGRGRPIEAISTRSDFVDWEAELVVVVGTATYRASREDAEAAIAGFTVGNDVSVRDWQLQTAQWTQGKAWQRLSPIGPYLTTTDEIGVCPDLEMTCSVDGELKQQVRTSTMIFDPPSLVAFCSRIVTLRPGDLIFTGTTAGVGISRRPPEYLRPGQVLTTSIEGIGELRNPVVSDGGA